MISWADGVRNEEVLHRVKEDRKILLAIKRRQADWIGQTLRMNFLLGHFIEGKIEAGIQLSGRREGVSSYWMILRKR
jgi:hypothetical protein